MPTLLADYKPIAIADTTGLSEETWLEYRRTGIGGSDASAVMGVSPFTTARDRGSFNRDKEQPAYRSGGLYRTACGGCSSRKRSGPLKSVERNPEKSGFSTKKYFRATKSQKAIFGG